MEGSFESKAKTEEDVKQDKSDTIITIKRTLFSNQSTIGKLYMYNTFQCYTLEDPVRKEKIKHITAIPSGQYEVIINRSNRFKKDMPLLLNVPNFSGVRIHAGNVPEHTDGCILVGRTYTIDFIGESKDAYDDLFEKIKSALSGGKVYLDIS